MPIGASIRTAVVSSLGSSHIAGPTVADAVAVARRHTTSGATVTLGPWVGAEDDPADVLDLYRRTIAGIEGASLPGSLSVKAPDLDHRLDLLEALADEAEAHDVPLHLDSVRAHTAGAGLACVEPVLRRHQRLGVTLPGRWRRSIHDASVVRSLGVRSVRVVKGQFADTGGRDVDPAAGFLAVVDALCGTEIEVGVATHDHALAVEALERLTRSGTPARLEQLFGFPMIDVAAVQDRFGVGLLVYVPFGHAYLPYALRQAIRNPRIVAWVGRDLLRSRRSG